ncbi:MAG: type II secretion system GspH family protein [Candidatus Berkelbacteria bacterium]|nr:type II secretion system GspH family protein [Candidatus Berkelbacteria bacterium]
MNRMLKLKSITLVEVMLAIAVLAIIMGVSAPVYGSLQRKSNVEMASSQAIQSLRRAQILAKSSKGDSNWGVKIEPGAITTYQGANFSSRNVQFDERTPIAPLTSITGLDEVNFSKFSGSPNQTGAITLTTDEVETKTININAKGTINY